MRQRNRTSPNRIGACAAIAAMVLGGGLAMLPLTPLHAADCLTAPNGAAPKGAHWYYRLERETKRQCWYTRAKSAAPTAAVAEAAAPEPAAAETPPPPPLSPPAPRNLSDARAEYVPTRELTDSNRGNVTPQQQPAEPFAAADAVAAPASPDLQSQRVAFANRWLERQAAQSDAAATSSERPADTTEIAAVTPSATTPAPVAADNSLWLLIAGLAAALGLAALIAHLVMRFGAPRPIIRRDEALYHDAIDDVAIPEPRSEAPWIEPAAPVHAAHVAADELDDEPPPMNWLRIARDRAQSAPSDDAIEQLLAKAPRPS
ncbi:hypothetical protein HNR60_001211 [Rhodopseudomonas rhenobacensis]|uniref:Uncharacterized protein n=1 Tax=Rhodopseudomonas rhenobacensis TaxID=87461 RepID=A0A7W7Z1U8_9BRAD|nr:hypothetical protein [Rhodopseudomonas rhenobacensis]MBB5046466.1 hypothetical protein [Rhodopseudomonas rhenobacensis]